jgi:hypothetical protein
MSIPTTNLGFARFSAFGPPVLVRLPSYTGFLIASPRLCASARMLPNDTVTRFVIFADRPASRSLS